jgi:hypothetical protein
MSGRFWAALAVLVPTVVVLLTLSAGMTNAYGSGAHVKASVGGWIPDGAAADTFWDSPFIDVPGLSVYAVHCHGRWRPDFQLGATGPAHNNPCYAAMGMYSGSTENYGIYMTLLDGKTAIYRSSVDDGPWTYYMGPLVYEGAPGPVP